MHPYSCARVMNGRGGDPREAPRSRLFVTLQAVDRVCRRSARDDVLTRGVEDTHRPATNEMQVTQQRLTAGSSSGNDALRFDNEYSDAEATLLL